MGPSGASSSSQRAVGRFPEDLGGRGTLLGRAVVEAGAADEAGPEAMGGLGAVSLALYEPAVMAAT